MSRNLQYHDIPLFFGVNTKFTPGSQSGRTLISCQNMDTFATFRTLAKVPGSTRETSGGALPATVDSLHQYTYTALDGTITYKQLASSNGALYDITSGTGVSLWSSPALVAEPLIGFTHEDRIYLSSENQRALATGGLKYDGGNARNWGVVRPGDQPTVLLNTDDYTDWTDSTDATSSDLTFSRDGDGSIGVVKDGTASADAYIEQTTLGADWSASVQAYIWLYIPPGGLQSLKTSGTAVEIRYGSASLTNANRSQFEIGELLPGWNLLSIDLDDPDATDGSGATLSSIDTVRLLITASAAGTTWTTPFGWDYFYRVDKGFATAAVGDDSNVTGTVSHRVTFLTEAGVESNAGPATTAVSPSAAAATVVLSYTGQPTDADTITIDGDVYTFKDSLTPLEREVKIGDSAADTYDNLADAVNGTGDVGITYASVTTAHPTCTGSNDGTDDFTVTYRTTGTGGNSATIAESAANVSIDGAASTLSGGRAGQEVDLTALPVSTDGQVIARRIYRDLDGDNVYRFVDQVDDNVTTTFTDTLAAASLGSATMPIAGDDQIDASPPERMRACVFHENRVYGIAGDDPEIILVSDVNAPEEFRLLDQLSVDEELIGLASHPFGLVLYGRHRTFVLQGDGVSTPFSVQLLNAELGASSTRGIVTARGQQMVLDDLAINHVLDPRDPWDVSQPIQDSLAAITAANRASCFAAHDPERNRILWFFNDATPWVYQYGTLGRQEITGEGAGVAPHDLRIAAWSQLNLPVTPTCATLVYQAASDPELWFGASDGNVYRLQDESAVTYANGASTSAITATFETAPLPLGASAVDAGAARAGRGEPRYIEVESESSTGITWAVVVTILSGPEGKTLGTSSFNLTCPSGNSQVAIPIPPAGVMGNHYRVKLTNSSATEVGEIRNLRVYYVPRVSRRGTQGA